MNVVHLDVKPDNILLGSDWNFKLCDFGCSAKNKEEFVKKLTGFDALPGLINCLDN